HTNWLNALRRSYNRRVTLRSDNPFYTWIKVPASVVEHERLLEREERERREAGRDGEGAAAGGGGGDEDDEGGEERKTSIFDDDDKLREAEKALYRSHGKGKKPSSSSALSSSSNKPATVVEAGPATMTSLDQVHEATEPTTTNNEVEVGQRDAVQPRPPVTERAFDDGFNAELSDVVAEDQAESRATDRIEREMEAKIEGREGEGGLQGEMKKEEEVKEEEEEEEEEWWEEQRAVEWKDLSLATKIDAIYNVCEWHMVDPDRQFRKYLSFDGESAWRLDPCGLDSDNNYYYHLSDDRLWVQREVPSVDEATRRGCPPCPDPVVKPRTLLGLRAGPRDKSKKGTVTGTVRFKLKRDAKTGQFRQVKDDDEDEEDESGDKPATTMSPVTDGPKPLSAPSSSARGRKASSSVAATAAAAGRNGGKANQNGAQKKRKKRKTRDDDDDDFMDGSDRRQFSKELSAEADEAELQDEVGSDDDAHDDLHAGDDGDEEEDPFAEFEDEEDRRKREEDEERKRIELRLEREKEEEQNREMHEWEKEFWQERWRAENTPGFHEWEAVCTTLDEWKAFADRFEDSQDDDELALREYALNWIPEYEHQLAAKAKEREAELSALQRRVSSRSGRDSTMDTVARLGAAEAALNDRHGRDTRPRAAKSKAAGGGGGGGGAFDESGDPAKGAGAGLGTGSGSGATKPVGESREERLRKREEEKRAREEAEEKRALDELREREREEAREKNGGVLPYEMMDDEEKEAFDKQQEKERKRLEKEQEKKKKEDLKRARARERRAELKAQREAAEQEQAEFEAEINPPESDEAAPAATAYGHVDPYAAHAQAAAAQVPMPQPAMAVAAGASEEPPWYTDCEVCGRQGWNIDDGVETICCEQCEEWQHLPCHIQRDALEGRSVPYSDDAYQFYCVRCQAQPTRRPRPIPPRHLLPPPPPPIAVPPPVPSPVAASGGKRKASGSGAKGTKGQPAQKKAKAAKATNGQVPYGHGHHPLYHPSAYSHAHAVHSVSPTLSAHNASPPAAGHASAVHPAHHHQPTPPAQAAPAPAHQPPQQAQPSAAPAQPPQQQQQQPQMTYEELSARVQQDPRLLSQLPPAYQTHFAEKFGLTLPGQP
ncbi:hypothetical protein JCM10212_001842, partial [Sporobolomyces blumeae]